jgi:hypothetical protein
LEKFKNMLLVLDAAGAFHASEESIGGELWDLTWAVVAERFPACQGLKVELFGGEEEGEGGREGGREAP